MARTFVICESSDGWSIHSPGASDAEIACGDAPALASGPWSDDEHEIPPWGFIAARVASGEELVRVYGGEPGTEEYDTGVVQKIDGERALVGWDSGVAAWGPLASLVPSTEHSAGGFGVRE